NGELPTSPNLKKSLIAFGRDVIASGIDNARQTQTIEFEEELLRTFDLLFERRLWKAIEEFHHIYRNDSGGITTGIIFHLRRARKVGIRADDESPKLKGCHYGPAVSKLDVHRIVGRRGHEFGLSRTPFFFESFRGRRRRDDDEPRARFRLLCSIADTAES